MENLPDCLRVGCVESQVRPLPGHWSCLLRSGFGPSIKVSGDGSVAARVAPEWSDRKV